VTKFELTRGQLRAMMMIGIITGEQAEEQLRDAIRCWLAFRRANLVKAGIHIPHEDELESLDDKQFAMLLNPLLRKWESP
jgi:hypothetical protein